jgi:hypothetical protein
VQLNKKSQKRSQTSTLVHRRLEKKNASPLIEKTVFETRGVRSFAAEIFKDHRLTVAASLLRETPFETYLMFMEAADYWLSEAGERKFLEVAEMAEAAKADTTDDESKPLIDDVTFQQWAAQIAERHGHLSLASIAAHFLRTSDYLHRRLSDDADLQQAVYAFAQAWHWFHFEAKGEHELAMRGMKGVEDFAAGPQAVHERAILGDRIVSNAVAAYAGDETKGNKRKSPKAAAADLLDQINRSFQDLKLRPLKQDTLAKKIRALMRERLS